MVGRALVEVACDGLRNGIARYCSSTAVAVFRIVCVLHDMSFVYSTKLT